MANSLSNEGYKNHISLSSKLVITDGHGKATTTLSYILKDGSYVVGVLVEGNYKIN